MRYIEVAAKNNRLYLFELLAIRKEGRVPVLMAQAQAREVALGVGCVDAQNKKVRVFRGNYPPFGVWVAVVIGVELEFFDYRLGKAGRDRERFFFGEDGGSGVTFFTARRIPILLILGEVDFALVLLGLCLLQTQNIGFIFFHKRHKNSFFVYRPQAINIPRNNLHARIISCVME